VAEWHDMVVCTRDLGQERQACRFFRGILGSLDVERWVGVVGSCWAMEGGECIEMECNEGSSLSSGLLFTAVLHGVFGRGLRGQMARGGGCRAGDCKVGRRWMVISVCLARIEFVSRPSC
jgi:hypothetical protein